MVARFVQERSILVGLGDPNLVRVRDLVVEGETLAIVMDLVEGVDLRRFLRDEGGTLAPARAVELGAQVCQGLRAVHAAGVIHRDVKPENVLVEANGSVLARLTDFGVSRFADGPTLTRVTGMIGTPEYMAPELAEHDQASAAVDVYSAGILLYELCWGRTPFAGGTALSVVRRHADLDPPRPPGLPDDLWALLAAMLAKDPPSVPARWRLLRASGTSSLASATSPPLARHRRPALRARLRQRPQDQDRGHDRQDPTPTTPEPEPAGATRLGGRGQHEPEPVTPTTAEATNAWWRQRPKALVAGGAAALVAVVALVAVLAGGGSGGGGSGAGAFSSPLRYTFESTTLANGVTLTRVWTIHPTGTGQLAGQVTVHNQNATTWTGDATEVIPKSLANSVDNITFSPQPDVVLRRDPAVAYHLADLAANATQTFHYTVTLPPRTATNQHLRQWVQDQKNTPAPTTTTTTTTTIPPPTATPNTGAPTEMPPGHWVVALGSFTDPSNAERARQQLASSAPDAQVLHSDDYTSLRPGYWIVYVDHGFQSGTATVAFCHSLGLNSNHSCHGRYLSTVAGLDGSDPRFSASPGP